MSCEECMDFDTDLPVKKVSSLCNLIASIEVDNGMQHGCSLKLF